MLPLTARENGAEGGIRTHESLRNSARYLRENGSPLEIRTPIEGYKTLKPPSSRHSTENVNPHNQNTPPSHGEHKKPENHMTGY